MGLFLTEPKQPTEVKTSSSETAFDLDKLAYAVAMAETGDGEHGMGKTKKNHFGVMTWERGFREGKVYNSKEDSYADFKRIWQKHYGGFPTLAMAKKWTGNDNPQNWLNIVSFYYNQ